ncbi:hypothetical protein [Bosea sp. BK604]|uniref:hypothetical protein n=1 Tax=Bosea sp. BK604 TaxID=2512180 RepID=UPI001052D0C9|nr:hypothetical protein [Bosea sp. BK604]
MQWRISYLLTVALVVSACQIGPTAQLRTIEKANPTQTEGVNKLTGEKIIQSRGKRSDLLVSISSDAAWEDYGTAVIVKIRNKGAQPLHFGEASISAQQQQKAVPVLGYAGMQAAIDKKQQDEEALAAFGIALGAAAGGLAGSGRFNQATTAALQAGSVVAITASTASLAEAQANASAETDEAPKSFVSTATLAPKGTYGGLVVLAEADGGGAPLRLDVDVGGEIHSVIMRP